MTKILWDAGAENMPNDRGFMPDAWRDKGWEPRTWRSKDLRVWGIDILEDLREKLQEIHGKQMCFACVAVFLKDLEFLFFGCELPHAGLDHGW